MTINFEYSGSRGSRMGLLVLFGAAIEHNFPDYSAYLIFAALIFLGFSVSFERGENYNGR
ncbi:TPA: hypothetical protein ACGBUC_000534 [Klebsiella variicola]|uniref:hypothetical protein n=1 Tax=Klebsiella variicola TaxID=244366 RepID=UPI001403ED93|nr:hypothetical protein [Klebsiella variicola]